MAKQARKRRGGLTDAAVKAFKGGETRREIRDPGAQGLHLVVQPNGAKSWALRFRRPNGKPAKLTLGPLDLGDEPQGKPVLGAPLTLAAARTLAAEQLRQRKTGVDVAARHVAEKKQRAIQGANAAARAFGALARQFVDDHCRRYTRRWEDTARLLGLAYPKNGDEPNAIKGGLADRWKDREITSITGDDLYSVVDETRRLGVPGLKRRRNGPSDTQGRAMAAALSKMFGWLADHRKITANPAIDLYKPPAPEARERVLNMGLGNRRDDELRWFWSACDQVGEPFGPLLKLLLLTGCRRNEVAEMRRDELSADGTVWTIPGARTKNHRTHEVYLPPLARDLLSSVHKIEGKAGFVFTTNGKTAVSGWSKVKARLDGLMGETAAKEKRTIPEWRLHDLRRTAATGMAELGIAPHIVEAVINHISGHKGGVAGVYNRAVHVEERKAALERWAAHMLGVMTGTTAKVIPLHQATAIGGEARR